MTQPVYIAPPLPFAIGGLVTREPSHLVWCWLWAYSDNDGRTVTGLGMTEDDARRRMALVHADRARWKR